MLKLGQTVICYTPKRPIDGKEYHAAIVTGVETIGESDVASLYVIPSNGKPFAIWGIFDEAHTDRGKYPNAASWMLEAPPV